MRNSKTKGFTLVELIVVIAIIAILAAILVPSMLTYIRNSRITQADANAKNVHTAAVAAVTQAYVDGKLGAGDVPTGTGIDVVNSGGEIKITINSKDVSLKAELGGKLDGVAKVWYDSATSAVTGAAWTKNTSSTIGDWPSNNEVSKSADPIIGYFPAVTRTEGASAAASST